MLSDMKRKDRIFYICFILCCIVVIGIMAKLLGGRSTKNEDYALTATAEKIENDRILVTVEKDESGTLKSGDEALCSLRQDKLGGQINNGVFTISDRGDVVTVKVGDKVDITYLYADMNAEKTPKELKISGIKLAP